MLLWVVRKAIRVLLRHLKENSAVETTIKLKGKARLVMSEL